MCVCSVCVCACVHLVCASFKIAFSLAPFQPLLQKATQETLTHRRENVVCKIVELDRTTLVCVCMRMPIDLCVWVCVLILYPRRQNGAHSTRHTHTQRQTFAEPAPTPRTPDDEYIYIRYLCIFLLPRNFELCLCV